MLVLVLKSQVDKNNYFYLDLAMYLYVFFYHIKCVYGLVLHIFYDMHTRIHIHTYIYIHLLSSSGNLIRNNI